MKQTTENLSNLLQNELFLDLDNFVEVCNTKSINNVSHQEESLLDSIQLLIYFRDLVLESISNGTFEESTSFSERQTFHKYFSNINTYISQIKNSNLNTSQLQGHANNAIVSIAALKPFVRNTGLEKQIEGFPSYKEKLSNIRTLQSRYKSLVKKLEESTQIQKKWSSILHDISTKNKELAQFHQSSKQLLSEIQAIHQNVKDLLVSSKLDSQSIFENKTKAEQNKDSILEFFKQVDNYESDIKEGSSTLQATINISQERIDEELERVQEHSNKICSELESKSDAVIEKNKVLQKEILDILGKAIGTRLYRSFAEKAKGKQIAHWVWFVFLCLSIGFLSWLGFGLVSEIKSVIGKGGKGILNLETMFILRLALLFPGIYAVYFTASQFKAVSRLLEEYHFKSAVAVALHHYKELVENGKSDTETQKFLIQSISSIFESPTEKVYHKPPKNKAVHKEAKSMMGHVTDIVKSLNQVPTNEQNDS